MSGRLVVIEGLDGSGKATQAALLGERLPGARRLSFPCYGQPSAEPVRMYLEGQMGQSAGDVNCYAASAFFAVDRCASFLSDWSRDYRAGRLIICDRYTTSNALYQAGKLPVGERGDFLDWLFDFEYYKLCIPRPDLVIYLDMPPEVSARLMSGRYGGDEGKKDIHERDLGLQAAAREAALFCAGREGWRVLPCAEDGRPLDPVQIAEKIDNILKETSILC